MEDRATGIFITILAILIFIFPGIAGICFGFASLVDAMLGFGVFASDQATYLWFIFGGFCGGILLLVLATITIILALRKRKKSATPVSNEPIPPTI